MKTAKTIKILGFLFLFGFTQPVFSHGTVSYPPSRIYNCYTNPGTAVCNACGGAIYDWMSVLQPGTDNGNHPAFVPDGQIASGGNGGPGGRFSCLDALTTEWPTTTVNSGYIDVVWRNSAPHKTEYYIVYITPLNWDPTRPLRWDELIEIGRVGKRNAEPFTTIRSFIPATYEGRRAAIVSVWQRDFTQSHEAFYSVSDISVGEGAPCSDGDPVSVTFENETDCALEYYEGNALQESVNAGGAYAANTTIGSQWEARQAAGDRIDSFIVTCRQSTYVSSGSCDEGCDLATWSASSTYISGDRVIYNDIAYEAKWWTRGDNPAQNSGINDVWRNDGICAGGGCDTGDDVYVTFENDTDCTLQYYLDNALQGSANPGGFYTTNTAAGSQWEVRGTFGDQLDSFAVTCSQATYTSAGSCGDGVTDGCAVAYGPYPNVYMQGDIVSQNGHNYECLADNLFNVTPGTAAHWWKDLGPCSTVTTSQQIILYPVPVVQGTLNVQTQGQNTDEFNTAVPRSVIIYNEMNSVVLTSTIVGDDANVDVSNLGPGIYYVYVEGSIEMKRILVQ